jgi:hypothetical protein
MDSVYETEVLLTVTLDAIQPADSIVQVLDQPEPCSDAFLPGMQRERFPSMPWRLVI